MDVSRGLLLPDIRRPTDGLLKTLSVYWDELVVPDYLERAVGPGSTEFIEVSETFEALEEGGVLTRWNREIVLPQVDSSELPDVTLPEKGSDATELEELKRVLKWIVRPISEAIPKLGEFEEDEIQKYVQDHQDEAHAAVSNLFESMREYAAGHYLGRMQDAFELSSQHNLAPLAQSPVSHVASIVGAPTDAPRSEAALLSAAVQAFEIDPATPIEQLLQFREKNKAALGRFRASLVDLSDGMRRDGNPTQLLAVARDTYRNRVVPALGDLEEVLKEGQIRFFIKSLLGATAIALAPVEPVKAVEGGATLMGQTLNYSFSRQKLIREHPFGFLHQVSSELRPNQPGPSTDALALTIADPVQQVKKMIEEGQSLYLERFFFSGPRADDLQE